MVLVRLCKGLSHILLGILKATFTETQKKSIEYNRKGYLKDCILSCYKVHGISQKSIGKNVLIVFHLDHEILTYQITLSEIDNNNNVKSQNSILLW